MPMKSGISKEYNLYEKSALFFCKADVFLVIGKIILYFFEKTLDKGKNICYYNTNLLGR